MKSFILSFAKRNVLFCSGSIVLLICLFCAGCGSSERKYTIEGSVSYAGEMVQEGTISFVPADSKKFPEGATIVNGKYSCQARPGINTVQITGSKPNPKEAFNGIVPWTDFIPEKYGAKSELTVEVKGNQTENFDLK